MQPDAPLDPDAEAQRAFEEAYADDQTYGGVRRTRDRGSGAAPVRPAKLVDLEDFLNLEIPPRVPLLGKWLCEQTLCMLHAWRGVGKTWFTLCVAYAVATGGRFLGWQAPMPAGVVYLDGEMSSRDLQARFVEIGAMMGGAPPKGMLGIITPDLQDGPMPDLASEEGQRWVDKSIPPGTRLIIFDNVSALARSDADENDAASWTSLSRWGLKHRREGRAVLFVHHSGKTGKQRGTSKREDLLDVVLQLKRPPDYDERDGAAFELHFEKARSILGEDVDPIIARLEKGAGGLLTWTTGTVRKDNADRIIELWNLGDMSSADIAREVDVNKSTVSRCVRAAFERGDTQRPPPGEKRNTSRNANATNRRKALFP